MRTIRLEYFGSTSSQHFVRIAHRIGITIAPPREPHSLKPNHPERLGLRSLGQKQVARLRLGADVIPIKRRGGIQSYEVARRFCSRVAITTALLSDSVTYAEITDGCEAGVSSGSLYSSNSSRRTDPQCPV